MSRNFGILINLQPVTKFNYLRSKFHEVFKDIKLLERWLVFLGCEVRNFGCFFFISSVIKCYRAKREHLYLREINT
jgi:hypothetical protein